MQKQIVIDEFYDNCKRDTALCKYLWTECEKDRRGDIDVAIFHYDRYDFEMKDETLIVADDVYFADIGAVHLNMADVLGVCAWRIAEDEGSFMTYTLYYRDIALGRIVQVYANFPGFFGFYMLFEDIEKERTEMASHIMRYVALSIREYKQEYACEEQGYEDFVDIIESEEWSLVGKNGTICKILIPSFCTNNKVVWRLG